MEKKENFLIYLMRLLWVLLFVLLMPIVMWIYEQVQHRKYVAQQARWIFGVSSPSWFDREQLLKGNNIDALAWLVCYDYSKRRRIGAWEKIKDMKCPRSMTFLSIVIERERHISRRILYWIKTEAKDSFVSSEAKVLMESLYPKQ